MKRTVLVLLAAIAAAYVSYTLVKYPPGKKAELEAPAPTVTAKTFELEIKDKKLAKGPQELNVNQNDQVTIKITCDCDEEFHIHGYDKSVDMESGKTVELAFTADLSGRFPYEIEDSKVDLGALNVQPR